MRLITPYIFISSCSVADRRRDLGGADLLLGQQPAADAVLPVEYTPANNDVGRPFPPATPVTQRPNDVPERLGELVLVVVLVGHQLCGSRHNSFLHLVTGGRQYAVFRCNSPP